jgi:hypothetical protein
MIVRKFGLLLVSAAGLMAVSGVAVASPFDVDATQVLWGAGSVADTAGTQNATQSTAPSDSSTASVDDRMVCRSMAPETGTRIGTRRVCHTQAQWDAISREDQTKTNQIQQHGFQQNLPHG